MGAEPFGFNDIFYSGYLLVLVGFFWGVVNSFQYELKEYLHQQFVARVTVKSTTDTYYWMIMWIRNQSFNNDSCNLSLSTTVGETTYVEEKNPLHFVLGHGSHIFYYKGHRIWLHRHHDANSKNMYRDIEVLTFYTLSKNAAILKEICDEARRFAMASSEGKISVYENADGDWERSFVRKKRPLSTVILNDEVAEMIVKDVRWFLSAHQWYEDRGIPYRRGYLLYGPPGCGKSSLIMAVASELNLNICSLSLSNSKMTDKLLNSTMKGVPDHSIVLLEDVDAIFSQRTSDKDSASQVTFSGLLNVLDGVIAPEGRLVFMTTNHKEKLDKALIRPGRADVHFQIGLACKLQMQRLFKAFFPKCADHTAIEFAEKIPNNSFSMATLQSHLMQYVDSEIDALNAVDELLAEGKGVENEAKK